MTRVLVVRHAESEWNAERRWQGWADPPLSAQGMRQAEGAIGDLGAVCPGFALVVTSDLERARATAEIVARGLELAAPAVDERWRERDVGDWTGLTSDEISVRWPDEYRAWKNGQLPDPPGGEAMESMVTRARSALAAVTEGATAMAGHPVLVITHGGLLRVLEMSFGVEFAPVPNLTGRWFDDGEPDVVFGARPASLSDSAVRSSVRW